MLNALLSSLDLEADVAECSIRDFGFLDDRPLNISMTPEKLLARTGLSFRTVESCCQEFSSRVGV